MNRWFFVLAPALLLATQVPAQTPEPLFERDILPIFNAHCLQCHGGLHQKGKLDLRTLAAISTGGRNGNPLYPGEPEKSLLWQRIQNDEMPPRPIKVSPEQKQLIQQWLKQGAKAAPQNVGLFVPTKARTAAELAALIDRAIDARLAQAKIPASPAADDGEFLRRLYLDVHGRIPTRLQAQVFLDSKETHRRQQLIETLLAEPAYGQYWSRLWRDRVAVPIGASEDLGGRHTLAFQQWLSDAFNKNRPWNELVKEMVTAEGESPPVAFIRQCMDDGQPRAGKLAASTARRFLGVQLQCAECHDHPFTTWKQDDFWGLAAFFSRTASVGKTRTSTRVGIFETEAGPPKTRFGLKPLVRKEAGAVALPEDAGPRAGKVVVAKFLEGGAVSLSDKEPARPILADWITSTKNAYFARATVNRLWAQLFGRGLVEPVDSLDPENLPTHPELLQALAGELVASGYDLKHLLRGMLLSQAYERSHQPLPGNAQDTTLYSHATIKVIAPESFYDCLVLASGGDLKDARATLAASGRRGKGEVLASRTDFLKLFGTADIDGSPGEYTQGIPQVLALLNESAMNAPNKQVEQATREKGTDEAILTRLYLGVLSRHPRAEELALTSEFLSRRASDPLRYQAIWWALVNSPEFALIP